MSRGRKAPAAFVNGLAALGRLPPRSSLDSSPEGIDSSANAYLAPAISGEAFAGTDVEIELPRTPPATRTLSRAKQNVSVAVNVLVCAALDVLDTRLTPEQRHLAEQIYELCNSIEATI
jgi:hypothetical protein